MAVKMNSATITNNYAADAEIGFLAKSISKSNDRATVMPAAWELIKKLFRSIRLFPINVKYPD